ncbi:MAG: TldD/PmbA family protein [Desulfurococcales archaeon]|nr:TldD/PmbA family protein [Desulfurococcales archaeon]
MKEFVLELAKQSVERGVGLGFDDVVAKVVSNEKSMVKVANSQLTVAQSWRAVNLELYLTKDRKIVLVEAPVKGKEDVERVYSRIGDYIKSVSESEMYAPLPEPSGRPLEGLVDPKIIDSMYRSPELIAEVVSAAHGEGAEKAAGTLTLDVERKALATSTGAEFYEEGTSIEVYLRAFYKDSTGHWAYGSRILDMGALKEVGRRAAYYARLVTNVVDVPPRRYDVVLSPLVVGNLIELVASAASAFAVLAGFSMFMKFERGDVVASERFSLIDDPLQKSLPGSTGFDDEGVATSTKPIIKEGRFENLLHNSKTAAVMKTESTGNAGLIMPHPWNVVIPAGDFSEEEMIRDIKDGLLINNNWYTRLQNYVEGIFSTVTRDAVYRVSNGEVVGVVRRLRIADTLTNLLKNVVGLSKSVYDIRWWEVGTPSKVPYVLVRNVNITKPTV